MHVVGFAMQVMEMPFSNQEEFVEMGKKALAETSAEEFPYLSEHIQFHLAGHDRKSDFKFMLDLILDGLERDFIQIRQ